MQTQTGARCDSHRYRITEAPMFWLLFLALMILVPLLARVHTWHEQRQKAATAAMP
jgi:hypothetical protein